MMEKYLVFVIAFGVLVCDNIRLVQCADQCKTHADCPSQYLSYCCGGYLILGRKDRTCKSSSCLHRYCSNDSDCGDQSMCCRSNTCVNKGCSGCTSNTDCYSSHVCCKKTFLCDQTVCADNCVGQICNSNDDCGGRSECCRSGKCTNDCHDKCTSHSECNLDQYCCKHKESYFWGDNCAKSCVGEMCRTDDDCGARNVCCISNKCVDRGCFGCTNNTDCSTGQYCCHKNRQSFFGKFSVCSEHCVGKSCSTSDDCGGPGETCNSGHKCIVKQSSNTASNSLPSWLIAVITVSLIVFLIAVGIILVVFWYVKRKQPANATRTVTVPLQDTRHRGAQTFVTQNPAKNSRQSNENHGFDINISPIYKGPTSSDEVHQDHNQLYNPVHHTLESPETTKESQLGVNSGKQMYPQITAQGNDYSHHPPFNPMYQSKR